MTHQPDEINQANPDAVAAGSPYKHIIRWEDPDTEHEVLAELRTQPGRWGLLQEGIHYNMFGYPVVCEAVAACQAESQTKLEQRGSRIYGMWMTDQEYADKVAEALAGPAMSEEPGSQ